MVKCNLTLNALQELMQIALDPIVLISADAVDPVLRQQYVVKSGAQLEHILDVRQESNSIGTRRILKRFFSRPKKHSTSLRCDSSQAVNFANFVSDVDFAPLIVSGYWWYPPSHMT